MTGCRCAYSGASHKCRDLARRAASQPLGQVDSMDHVHQHAAASRQRMPPIGLVFRRAGIIDDAQEMQGNHARVANQALADQPLEQPVFGQEMIIVHHRHGQASRRGRLRQLMRQRRAVADRLLAEHMLASRQGIQHDARAELLRHSDDHRVDGIHGQDIAVIGVKLALIQREPVFADGAAGRRDIRECQQLQPRQGHQGRAMTVIDHIAAADQADFEGFRHFAPQSAGLRILCGLFVHSHFWMRRNKEVRLK